MFAFRHNHRIHKPLTAHVRFGSKADMCSAQRHVRFTPNSDRKSGLSQWAMSALPSKAEMCSALANVCFGPKADISEAHVMSIFIARNRARLFQRGGLDCAHHVPCGVG